MAFDYTIAAVVSFALLVYLTYALLRPERFCPAARLERLHPCP